MVPESLGGSVVSNEYTALHTTRELDPKFLDLLSHSIYFQQTCFHSSVGVTVEKLVFRLENWMDWEFDIPPLTEQRRIVNLLGTWSDAIDRSEGLIAAKRRYKTCIVGRALFDVAAKRGFIRDLAAVNPRNEKVEASKAVSFVGMEDVSEFGALVTKTDCVRRELGSGYTQFCNGDVLVAKITPCFENGKGALAHNLTNGVGFGTTEFHVLRPHDPADADYLHQLTLTRSFRVAGERQMTGSAGQRRVPAEFIEDFPIFIMDDTARQSIGSLLASIDAEIQILELQATLLRTQKRGLMQKLLSGERQLDERFDPSAAVCRPTFVGGMP